MKLHNIQFWNTFKFYGIKNSKATYVLCMITVRDGIIFLSLKLLYRLTLQAYIKHYIKVKYIRNQKGFNTLTEYLK